MSSTTSENRLSAESRRYPGWMARLVIGVTLSFLVAVRLLGRTADPPWPLNDPAICNLLTLVFAFIAALTAWTWFCFRSGFSLVARRLSFIAPLVVIAGMFATLRVVGVTRLIHVSGSMMP